MLLEHCRILIGLYEARNRLWIFVFCCCAFTFFSGRLWSSSSSSSSRALVGGGGSRLAYNEWAQALSLSTSQLWRRFVTTNNFMIYETFNYQVTTCQPSRSLGGECILLCSRFLPVLEKLQQPGRNKCLKQGKDRHRDHERR